jgi:crotonobetainyl-CoA:carnitine CoA-transferase CaiB-like acyl-CoA transferase
MASAPLDGITVAEFGNTIAGPFAARILGDLGADVVKIEPVNGGDPVRKWPRPNLGGMPATFQALNRGKRSVAVDLRKAEDRDALFRFVTEKADVLIQNTRPGAMEKLGLGPSVLCAAAPRLVYCNISGFGRAGPLKDLAGYDPLMQAFSGIVSVTGEPDRPPSRVGVSIVDIATATWAVIGIQAALVRRNATGKGGVVDASLFESALNMMIMPLVQYLGGGAVPQRMGLRGPLVAPNRAFQTADGLLVITTAADAQFVRLCQVIGRPEMATDPRYLTVGDRMENDEPLSAVISEAVAKKSRAEWAALLDAAGIPNAPIQSLDEVMKHAQTIAVGMVQSSAQADFQLLGLPISIDGERPAFGKPAPELGADTQLLFDFARDVAD